MLNFVVPLIHHQCICRSLQQLWFAAVWVEICRSSCQSVVTTLGQIFVSLLSLQYSWQWWKCWFLLTVTIVNHKRDRRQNYNDVVFQHTQTSIRCQVHNTITWNVGTHSSKLWPYTNVGEGHSFAMQQYIHATGVANTTDYFSGQKVILRATRNIWLHVKTSGSGLTELAFLLLKMC